MSNPMSPLADFLVSWRERPRPQAPGVYLSERPFLGYLNLRGEADDQHFLGGAEQCLGLPLPLEPNTTTENDGLTTLWLGPGEWLVITPPRSEGTFIQKLRTDLAGLSCAVTDVTHNQTIIRISGDRARDVLHKGCSLDFHPTVFGPGRCAQTLIDKVGITVRRVPEAPCFDLIVRRSFAEYLTLWLTDAAEEYGFRVNTGDPE